MYGSNTWFPNVTDIQKLENFQSRMSKWMICKSGYKNRLTYLNLLPISLLYQLHDIILFNKLINELYTFDIWNFISLKYDTRLRSNLTPVFRASSNRLRKTDQSFFSRTTMVANYLQKRYKINLFDDVKSLRRSIYRVMFTYFTAEYDKHSCKRFVKCYCCL